MEGFQHQRNPACFRWIATIRMIRVEGRDTVTSAKLLTMGTGLGLPSILESEPSFHLSDSKVSAPHTPAVPRQGSECVVGVGKAHERFMLPSFRVLVCSGLRIKNRVLQALKARLDITGLGLG